MGQIDVSGVFWKRREVGARLGNLLDEVRLPHSNGPIALVTVNSATENSLLGLAVSLAAC